MRVLLISRHVRLRGDSFGGLRPRNFVSKPELIKQACGEDIQLLRDIDVREEVSREESMSNPIRTVVGVRQAQHNKEHCAQQQVRRRFITREFASG